MQFSHLLSGSGALRAHDSRGYLTIISNRTASILVVTGTSMLDTSIFRSLSSSTIVKSRLLVPAYLDK